MEFTIIVITLALAEYLFFVGKTGQYRGRYEIHAPVCTGDVNFERMFRIQQNTLEQLIVFIPAMLIFAYYVSPLWGAGIGLIVVVGRLIYFQAYLNDPPKRGPGMIMTFIPNCLLVLGGLVGAILSLL